MAMRKINFFVAIILFLISFQAVQAGTFYLHDHPSYWWYVVQEPAFSAVIPSTAENYNQRSIFGMEILEMTFANGTIVMDVIYQPGKDVEAVRASLEERYRPLVTNVALLADREITTSNNLKAYFYAYEATGSQGKRVMLRSVFFQKDEHILYLTMFCDSDQYQGDVREYWLRAVNGLEWN